jgi:hypothetical protein
MPDVHDLHNRLLAQCPRCVERTSEPVGNHVQQSAELGALVEQSRGVAIERI